METQNSERAISDYFAQQAGRPDNPRQVIRELVALVHALAGGYIETPRNPYTLDAVRKGNLWLTGDPTDCGFSESLAQSRLGITKGRGPVTSDL